MQLGTNVEPTNILTALERIRAQSMDEQSDSSSIMTIAAFLLVAGVCHIPRLREIALPPEEELKSLGFNNWVAHSSVIQASFNIKDFPFDQTDQEQIDETNTEYYYQLSELIEIALNSGDPNDTARMISFGLHSPNDIIRICALTSAIDLFDLRSLNLFQRFSWYFSREASEITLQILGILMSRVQGLQLLGSTPPAYTPGILQTSKPDLMLIHGTVLPTSQANRPTWSIPGTGSLFNHLHTIRPNIYGASDYFRWEGGYTDYAREVASLNLNDWLKLRKLNGIDAVAHSHGCNVLMAATKLQSQFGKIILLNCPVHWNKYSLTPHLYSNAVSVRIKFDFVILADRGGQRFPKNTIPEKILPLWFDAHSDATSPVVWQGQNLDRLL